MPAPPYIYQSFGGGLDTKDAPFVIQDDAGRARDVQNLQATTAGSLVKRNGLATFATPADTLNSLFSCEATAASFLIGAGGTSLYKITTGGVSSVIKTGLTSGKPWEFATITASGGAGPLFGLNGTDAPQQWDGVAATTSNWVATSGAVPNGKYMASFGNRVWVAGTAAFPSRLYFSDLAINGGAMAWPAANVLDLDPGDGQTITGIGHVGPYLLVTKQRKCFIVYDQDTGANRRIAENVGCISHRSIAEGPAGTYFLAEDRGVYVTDGTRVQPLSDIIQPTIDTIIPGTRNLAAGVCFQGHYYLSVCRSGTVNDTILDYDEVLQSWWVHTFGSAQWAIFHPLNVANLYSAKPASAVVDQAFAPGVLVDNGTRFKWIWRGPWQSPSYARRRRFPTPYYRKRLKQVRVLGNGTVDVSLGTDFSGGEVLRQSNVFAPATGTFGGSGLYGGAGLFGDQPMVSQGRLFSLGVADAFSLVFSATSNTSDQVTMYTLIIHDRADMAAVN